MEFSRNLALLCGLLIGINSIANADANPWEDYQSLEAKRIQQTATHQKGRELVLDEQAMKAMLEPSEITFLKTTSARKATKQIQQQLSIPLSDGSTLSVSIIEDAILPKQLADKYPNIKTYRVIPDALIIGGRIDITPNGFHAMIQARRGDTFFIDPRGSLDAYTNKRRYVSYRKQDQKQSSETAYSCGASVDSVLNLTERSVKTTSQRLTERNANSLLNYKIAIAATGEYVAKKGGTVEHALGAIVTTINRVNQVYELDLGIHLSLVENNDLLIYADADSDPYNASNQDGLIRQNQSNIDAVIGSENYDLGHLFTTKGGGLAAIASVCGNGRKAKGISGVTNPVNDGFNLDFVAHEIGHQLGATHTFNGIEGLCSGSTRESKTAFEPGSGSTIMSYAGYCGVDNIQSHSDAMLHIGSINQIRDFTLNDRGSRCGVRRQAQNSAPTINAGNNRVIPANTPFELIGTATDVDDDQLVFAWEQIDSGERSLSNRDTGDNALFRAHMPNSDSKRSFPPINDILNHSTAKGEALPIQQRKLNFSFVAQDGFNASQSDDVTVEVVRTGSRFALNLPRAHYDRGESHKVLWNVANTNKAPINCDAVDILLSTNGGYVFDTELAKNIPNTGEAWITIPAESKLGSEGRFKIMCSNNIFFAVSYRNFTLSEKGDGFARVYNDADQLEPSITDIIIGSGGNSPTIVSNQGADGETANGFNTAGGSIGFMMVGVLLSLFLRRRRFTV